MENSSVAEKFSTCVVRVDSLRYRTTARWNPCQPRTPNPGRAGKHFSFHPTFWHSLTHQHTPVIPNKYPLANTDEKLQHQLNIPSRQGEVFHITLQESSGQMLSLAYIQVPSLLCSKCYSIVGISPLKKEKEKWKLNDNSKSAYKIKHAKSSSLPPKYDARPWHCWQKHCKNLSCYLFPLIKALTCPWKHCSE